jgi:GTPase SAR1 family protein
MYYRGAHAAILVYDITSEDSLADVRVWLDELRRNMSSDLIVQIVGNKVDAAHHRKVDLEAAKLQIEKWLVEDDPATKGRTASEALSPTRDSSSSSRTGGLPSFSLSRSNSNRTRADTMPSSSSSNTLSPASSSLLRINFAASGQNPQANQPDLPAFKDIGISEVSAKADFDESIEDLFLTITSKLVERKVQIEHDRVLRRKDSIMITKEGDSKVQDTTRIWGCC